jgi:NitT/TauT family transport system substrate-binding protein
MGKKVLGTLMAGMLAIAMLTVGCGGGDKAGAPKSKELRPVRVGYFGGTCEAPIYVAYENGIFKKHGLNVELVKVKASTTKEMVATGKVDALMASPGTFKPIEQGMNIKLTAGIHTGCIQAVVPVDSPVKSVADLKGRTIGVESMGGPPMIYLSMEMLRIGMDPKKDVAWRVYPGPQLIQALEKKEIDAFGTWDPFPQIAANEGKARIFFSNTHTQPYADQLCCYVAINSKVVSDEPEIARLLTNAFAEATAWVGAHPKEAAQIGVDKKYVGGSLELNTQLLSAYKWISDPEKSRKDYAFFLNGMKQLNVLDASTQVEDLVKHSFVILAK